MEPGETSESSCTAEVATPAWSAKETARPSAYVAGVPPSVQMFSALQTPFSPPAHSRRVSAV